VVRVLASGTQDRGFKPGRSHRIFRAKKSSAREVKPSVPCRRFAACQRPLEITGFQVKFVGHFLPISVPCYRRALMSLDVEPLWGRRAELKVVHKGPASLRPRCDGVVAP